MKALLISFKESTSHAIFHTVTEISFFCELSQESLSHGRVYIKPATRLGQYHFELRSDVFYTVCKKMKLYCLVFCYCDEILILVCKKWQILVEKIDL